MSHLPSADAACQIRCGDRTFVIGERVLLMGILNLTPDSFSDGGQFNNSAAGIKHGLKLIEDGADIIDLGAESTRPFAQSITKEEELARLKPVLSALVREGISNISVDTRRSEVAKYALGEGASWINDVSALTYDPQMIAAVSPADAVVLMHSRGTPESMQAQRIVYDDVVAEVHSYLKRQTQTLVNAGFPKSKIIVDPGIGFGKLLEHNLLLSHNLSKLSDIAAALLYGPSRKKFIGEITAISDASLRDSATLGAVVYAALNGANIVRVHEVKAAREALMVAERIKGVA